MHEALPPLAGSSAPSGRTRAKSCTSTVRSGIQPSINTSQFNRSAAKLLFPGASGGGPREPWRVPIEFTVNLSADIPRGNQQQTSTMAWLRSTDGSVFLHAPAVYASSEDRAAGARMTVSIARIDPAAYDVWVFRLHGIGRDPATNQPRFRGIEFSGSPFRLRAQAAGGGRAGQRGAAARGAGGEPRLSLPQRRCELGSPDVYGRWVRCSAVCAESCLRDGWVFVPWDCSHRIYQPAAASATASRVARQRGRPLWIAVVGTSTYRGIAHTLVDLISPGTGFFDTSARSVAGRGTAVKCWGWFDYLHGGIRVSYQDWRLVYHDTWRNDTKYRLRLAQLLREGPDLILLMSPHPVRGREWLLSFYRQYAELVRSWDGTLVLLMMITTTAGPTLDSYYWPYAENGGRDSFQVEHGKLAAQLRELEATIPGVGGMTLLWSLDPMLWPVVFDTDQPIGSGKATAHWHRYAKVPGRRMLHGMGAEMAAHIALTALLERSSRLPYAQASAAAALAGASGGAGASVVCVNCPEKACCPWLEPETYPRYTLSSRPGELRLNASVSAYSCSRLS